MIRNYLIILAAFVIILSSGYGTGRLIGYRSGFDAAQRTTSAPEWRNDALVNLKSRLELRPEQISSVEDALDTTALQIQRTHDATLLAYLRHLDELYQSLDIVLDEGQAASLRAERSSLSAEIESLLEYKRMNNPPAKP